jgi:dihydrofolate synthase/folylpolyglutamate synthase
MYDPADASPLVRGLVRGTDDEPFEMFCDRHRFNAGPMGEQELRHAKAVYYGMVTNLDHQLGRLLGQLRLLGDGEQTLILYTSDHGEALGDHGLLGKRTFLECSAKVPMIVRPMATWRTDDYVPGRVSRDLVEWCDVLPTLCAAAGAHVPVEFAGTAAARYLADHPRHALDVHRCFTRPGLVRQCHLLDHGHRACRHDVNNFTNGYNATSYDATLVRPLVNLYAGSMRSGNGAQKLKRHQTLSVEGGDGVSAAVAEVRNLDITTYARAVRYLDSLIDFERRKVVRFTPEQFNLDRMRGLCRELGDPHLKYPTIHVAGSKGKGSTCAMIAAMLRAAGLTVGLYSSPHLVDVRERVRILRPGRDPLELPQGDMIPQAAMARLVAEVQPHCENARLRPTYFDALTAVAFQHFAEQQVDVAVIEVGLGGRLDSTNVVEPIVSVVTSISEDHLAQLGPTIADVAREKAGIFKPETVAITCEHADERVMPVLRQQAKDAGAELKVLGIDLEFTQRFEASRMLGRHNRVGFETERTRLDHLSVPLFGEHQATNCGLALAAVDEAKRHGLKITDHAMVAGLDGLTLEGRMEVLRREPLVIADCAHNPASIEALFRGIGQYFEADSTTVIFGCCDDKDVAGMLRQLAAGADKTIFCRVDSVRSADPRELQQRYLDDHARSSQAADTLDEALRLARRGVTDDDLLVITGSFYIVGAAKKRLAKKASRSNRAA